MIERIIVAEIIAASIERWINVDELDLTFISGKERGKGKEIVALEEKVVRGGVERRGGMCPVLVVAYGPEKRLGFEKPVHFVRRKDAVVKHLAALLVLLRLPAFEHAILVGEGEHDVRRRGKKASVRVRQADAVLEAREGIRKERAVFHYPTERRLVEDLGAVHLGEKAFLCIRVREQKPQQRRIQRRRRFRDLVPQKPSILRDIIPVRFEDRFEMLEK